MNTQRTLNPRTSDDGFEVAEATLSHPNGQRITLVALPIAAPEAYWADLRGREFAGTVYIDRQLDELNGLRGRRRRLARSAVESARTFLGTGGFLLADERMGQPDTWYDIPGETALPKFPGFALAILAGFAKLYSHIDDHDTARSFYLRAFVTPETPRKRPSWTSSADRALAERAAFVAEYLTGGPDDVALITGAGKSNHVLTWLESNGYTLDNLRYEIVVPRDEFGTNFDEDLARSRK